MRRVLLLLATATSLQAQQGPPAGPLAEGMRMRAAGKSDSAIAFFESIVAQRAAGTPRAYQELVGLYVSLKRLDDAHKAVQGMRASGGDFSLLVSTPGIASLRTDARFAMLFPDTSVFADPFVEKTRIIHEWRGESAGDEFGWIARGIGDVDGDKVTDVVVSATTNPPFGSSHGKLYVYSGKSGKQLWKRQGEQGWSLGTSVENAGDVDNDGVNDVIAGAPGSQIVLVLSGRDGREIHLVRGDTIGVSFGTAVAGVGDFDRDGHADFVVGAPFKSNTVRGSGRAVLYSGKTALPLLQLTGDTDNSMFGSAVSGHSGRFLAVGAPSAGAANRGRVYIFDGMSNKARFITDADSTGTALGAMFVANAGDVDGDRIPDFFATDYVNRAKGPATGRAYVYSTATGRTVLTLTGDSAGDTFGTSASYAGDVNKDGVADFAVGSWQFGGAAWSGGKVTVHSGKDGAVLQRFTGKVPGETLGFDAVGVGDIDGDGAVDFLVTSAYSLVNGLRSGRVFIVAGTKH